MTQFSLPTQTRFLPTKCILAFWAKTVRSRRAGPPHSLPRPSLLLASVHKFSQRRRASLFFTSTPKLLQLFGHNPDNPMPVALARPPRLPLYPPPCPARPALPPPCPACPACPAGLARLARPAPCPPPPPPASASLASCCQQRLKYLGHTCVPHQHEITTCRAMSVEIK